MKHSLLKPDNIFLLDLIYLINIIIKLDYGLGTLKMEYKL